ncbi:sialate O-acetylesterase [Pelomonas aquatica]|jgi:sialate O-acetylesterase|uniref:Sialate O-acetylesterase domain-containing protein n=1 Tax=Pelomonas aquatica TaxID=431058 RepID=A0A9X4LKN5_9BURK|nr:sialate O-acetylesterase [Pelomonas aquatica]MCY4754794.1 hypothetical protein [Pelomonas aquatica]MDG0861893.1 hypothetical protein [Pelomonas aquatica]
MKHPLAVLAISLCTATPLFAAVEVDSIFGDHMVVQRDKPVAVFGSAAAGELVKVAFGADVAETHAGVDGRWIVRLPARKAEAKPSQIRIVGVSNEVLLQDVLVGDVWITAGQSNMEFKLGQDAEGGAELQSAADPALRVATFEPLNKNVGALAFGPDDAQRLNPDSYYRGSWAAAAGPDAARASAVGYWFAKKIRAEVGIPVGVVGYAIGGAPLETFASREALTASGFGNKLSGDWMKNQELPTWVRARAAQNLAKLLDSPGDELGKNHGYKPAFAWESGMARIAEFPVRGFLWYQGESNAVEPARIAEYARLQALMAADWRAKWKDPKLPFYFVQLSACEAAERKHWGEFRDMQRRSVAAIPAPSGMAVSYDHGPPVDAKSDVHPNHKRPVGERLALLALRDVYGKPGMISSGPAPAEMTVRGGELVIGFDHAAGMKSSSGGQLAGFEISNDGAAWTPADARVEGHTVIVSAPGVSAPKAVRYAWASWCKDANLVNGAGLPASTFQLPASAQP